MIVVLPLQTVQPGDPSATVLEKMERSGQQLILVTDSDGRLQGTISDGDVRRAVIRGDLGSCSAGDLMNKQPRTATVRSSPGAILNLMRTHRLHALPLVDDHGRVAEIRFLEELLLPKVKENHVVLMAGGQGNRLRPLTHNRPKPLLPVGSKPILETILDEFSRHGFKKFALSVNYLATMIREHFGDGSTWGVEVEYLEEKVRLGTAGCLSLLPDDITWPIIVMNGDILTKVDFSSLLRAHETSGAAATMCVRAFDYEIPYGVVEMDGNQVAKIVEKPTFQHFVSAGIYVIGREVLELVPQNSYLDMPSLLNRVMCQGSHIEAFPVTEYWLDIGNPTDYDRANLDYYDVFER